MFYLVQSVFIFVKQMRAFRIISLRQMHRLLMFFVVIVFCTTG